MDLLLNFVATAVINLTPALVIRYLIKKRPLNKKSHAIIACVIIAICAWSIAYFIAFSPIGSGLIPTGFAEVIFGFINFYMLKPNTLNRTIVENELCDSESAEEQLPITMNEQNDSQLSTSTNKNMDATIEEYYDAMLPEEEKGDMPVAEPAKASKAAKLSIALNVILIIALCVSAKIYVNSKIQLTEAEESYNKVLESKKVMKVTYEEEISELNEQLDWYIDRYGINWDYFLENAREADKLDAEKEKADVNKKHKENVEKWNKENPDQPINEAGQPL